MLAAVTGQLAHATIDFACLVFVLLAACETATCPVRELAYPRVVELPWQLIRLFMHAVDYRQWRRRPPVTARFMFARRILSSFDVAVNLIKERRYVVEGRRYFVLCNLPTNAELVRGEL